MKSPVETGYWPKDFESSTFYKQFYILFYQQLTETLF
jgi:hypothetical protein